MCINPKCPRVFDAHAPHIHILGTLYFSSKRVFTTLCKHSAIAAQQPKLMRVTRLNVYPSPPRFEIRKIHAVNCIVAFVNTVQHSVN